MPDYTPTNINLTPYQRFYADAQGQQTLGPSRRGRAGEYVRHLLLRDMLAHREDLCRAGPLAPPVDTPAREEWRALTDALLYATPPPYPLPDMPPTAADPAPPRHADPKLAHLSIVDLARALRHAADTLADPAPTKRSRERFAELRSTAESLAHELTARAADLLRSLPDAPPAPALEPDSEADAAARWAEFMAGFDTAALREHLDRWRADGMETYVQQAEAELARRAV